ncbi:MAG: hypothetical protein CM1200mP3_05660 [Chloroflexota bacterium]|nr:MAG: hypothetical protein CM1200mP3_05660 [Chloroflexota bacterium]
MKEPGTETEFITGANAFTGLVSALLYRDLTGIGQKINTSILHSTLSSYSPYLLAACIPENPRNNKKKVTLRIGSCETVRVNECWA